MIKALPSCDAKLLAQIDRSEVITQCYRLQGSELVAFAAPFDVPCWEREELRQLIERNSAMRANGGSLLAYYLEEKLVGMVSLADKFLDQPSKYLVLDILYCSAQFRGRGVATKLFAAALDEAKIRSARGLYISATPTINSVDFYLKRGCCILAEPNPELFAKEPEDIHLGFLIAQQE
ncbi:MAG: hypothetical protein OFPI_11880 [Osedax symbiont Rs2]|nr:MAG: hypothetical protein OFPI_11880 [Osedax symbiont Rs2]